MSYYIVRNRTNVTQVLYDADGDAVHINGNATATIDAKFIEFQTPPIYIIQIIKKIETKVNQMKAVKAMRLEKEAQAEAKVESIKEKLHTNPTGGK